MGPSLMPAQLTKQRIAALNGSLVFGSLGGLLVPVVGNFSLQRTMNWTWDAKLQCFTTTIEVEGTLVMTRVVTLNSSSSGQEVTDTLSPSVNGSLTLRSKSYIGPGFSGRYNWSGDLVMVPNPFAVWNLSPAAVFEAAHAAPPPPANAVGPSPRPAVQAAEQRAAAHAAGSSNDFHNAQERSGSSGSRSKSGCGNNAGSSSEASCTARLPVAAGGGTATHLPGSRSSSSSSRALLQTSRGSNTSSSHLPVVGQVVVREFGAHINISSNSDIFAPSTADDHTIVVSGAYQPGLGVSEACWGTVSCPVVHTPQQGAPESNDLVDSQPGAAGSTNSNNNSTPPAAAAAIPPAVVEWIQIAGGLGGGLLAAALVGWLIIVFMKRAQQDEDEEQQRKERQQQQAADEAADEEAWQQLGQQQQVQAGAAVDEVSKLPAGAAGNEKLLPSGRSTKSGQSSRSLNGAAEAAARAALALTQQQQQQQQQADAVQWLPGAAARVSVDDSPQQQQQQQQQPAAAAVQAGKLSDRLYKPFTGLRRLPAEAAAAAAVQAGNRPAVVSAQWALAGSAAGGFAQQQPAARGGWDMPAPADGRQSMSTAVALHGAAAGSSAEGAYAAAGRQQQQQRQGLLGWLGRLLFGEQHQTAAAAAAAASPAGRPVKADYLHASANRSRQPRPGHASAAVHSRSSSGPSSLGYTAVMPYDDEAEAAAGAAAAAAAAATRPAAAGSSVAAGGGWVGSAASGRQSLRRRIRLSTSENSLMRLQSSNSRQQQAPGRPHSSSPVGGSEGAADLPSPRRTGRWFDNNTDPAAAVGDAAGASAAAAEANGNSLGIGNNSAVRADTPEASGLQQRQQQQQNRRSNAAGSASGRAPGAGARIAGVPGDGSSRAGQQPQLRHRAELQE
uniref:Uncharacterized protein n=1 Tax=Tetradesmus obliquus TaxID=3088 RepID=A0A383WBS1_TETOB|eukprot:jgi/Sobl393_1/19496/SZX74156.1